MLVLSTASNQRHETWQKGILIMMVKCAEYGTERHWIPRMQNHSVKLYCSQTRCSSTHTQHLCFISNQRRASLYSKQDRFSWEIQNKQTNKETKVPSPHIWHCSWCCHHSCVQEVTLPIVHSQIFIILWKAYINAYFLRITPLPKETRQHSQRWHVSLYSCDPLS